MDENGKIWLWMCFIIGFLWRCSWKKGKRGQLGQGQRVEKSKLEGVYGHEKGKTD